MEVCEHRATNLCCKTCAQANVRTEFQTCAYISHAHTVLTVMQQIHTAIRSHKYTSRPDYVCHALSFHFDMCEKGSRPCWHGGVGVAQQQFTVEIATVSHRFRLYRLLLIYYEFSSLLRASAGPPLAIWLGFTRTFTVFTWRCVPGSPRCAAITHRHLWSHVNWHVDSSCRRLVSCALMTLRSV